MQVKLYNDDGHTNTYNLNCYSFSAFTLSLSLSFTQLFSLHSPVGLYVVAGDFFMKPEADT